jgi:carboxymethylenebutenolidase
MAVNRGPDNGRVVETDVEIMTPDGSCDAAFTHPSSGSHPAVLLWADAFGLRPSMRAMAKRLAAGGYAVLVPNPFYRLTKAPFTDASKMNFSNPADMAKLRPLLETAKAPGHVETDAVAFFEFLDAQKAVNPKRKAGAHGYCMGGLLSLKTAARLPQRVGAAASFHGGGLVTDGPDSPHLLAHKIKAHIYVGIAENDDARQPDAKDKLRQAFASARVPAEIEVYPHALHGWCVPDMPPHDGIPVYNKAAAERAWSKLTALYNAGLA